MSYSITSLQHPLVKHLVKLRQNAHYRKEHNSVIIEGVKPILEISKQVPSIVTLTSKEEFLSRGIHSEKMLYVPPTILDKISGMVNSEGILAEFPMPKESLLNGVSNLLVLDAIHDPGNLGTLLRTALALGWGGIFIVNKGCDLFNEKVMRAARGAHFRLPFQYGSWNELKVFAKKHEMLPLLADIEGESLESIKAEQKIMLILSNEAHGASQEALSWCQKVTIPMSGKMESLNVSIAGAIIMHYFQRS